MSSETTTTPTKRRVPRRSVAKGAAWAAPAIAVAAPVAAAAVSDPCIHTGPYYVELWAPNSNSVLQNRASGAITHSNGCQMEDPDCGALVGTKTTLQGILLQQTGTNIIHHVTSGNANQGSLTFTLADESCCIITGVKAHVHRFGAASGSNGSGDCPSDYCQGPGSYFSVTGIGTNSVTANPHPTTTCPGGQQIHWGSPRWTGPGNNNNWGCNGANQAQPGANSNGQPYGYVRLELQCTGVNV